MQFLTNPGYLFDKQGRPKDPDFNIFVILVTSLRADPKLQHLVKPAILLQEDMRKWAGKLGVEFPEPKSFGLTYANGGRVRGGSFGDKRDVNWAAKVKEEISGILSHQQELEIRKRIEDDLEKIIAKANERFPLKETNANRKDFKDGDASLKLRQLAEPHINVLVSIKKNIKAGDIDFRTFNKVHTNVMNLGSLGSDVKSPSRGLALYPDYPKGGDDARPNDYAELAAICERKAAEKAPPLQQTSDDSTSTASSSMSSPIIGHRIRIVSDRIRSGESNENPITVERRSDHYNKENDPNEQAVTNLQNWIKREMCKAAKIKGAGVRFRDRFYTHEECEAVAKKENASKKAPSFNRGG